MKRKTRQKFNAQKTKRNAILIGVLSLLLLIGAITAAVLLGRKNNEDSSSSELSMASDISEPEESSEESEPSEELPPEPIILSAEDIPSPSDLHTVTVRENESTVWNKYFGYEGSLPVIVGVSCASDGRCIAQLLHKVEMNGDTATMQYEWRTVDPETRTFGDTVNDEWEEFSFDKNADNHIGFFGIEYENPEIKRGPFAVYYQTSDVRTVICYGEDDYAFARLIRQNDDYAVYSLNHDDESEYFVIDQKGNTVFELGWDADIAVTAPLMFYHDFLICKTDTDDDSVYDTVSIIDLKDGSSRDLLSLGNCRRWTYAADGGIVAVFGKEDAENKLFVIRTEGLLNGKTDPFIIESDAPFAKADVIGTTVRAETDGELRDLYFGYHDKKSDSFVTSKKSSLSEEAIVVNGEGIVAVLDQGTLTVYKQ